MARPNSRIYYACQAVSMSGPYGINPNAGLTQAFQYIPGIQSVTVGTNFSLQPVFQFGQSELYENMESIPEVDISLSKLFDGWPMLYHLAVGQGKLSEVMHHRCGVRLSIGMDTDKPFGTNAQHQAPSQLTMIPAYLSSATFSLGVADKFTETVTLVSNDRSWASTQGESLSSPNPDTSLTADGRSAPTALGIGQKQHLNLVETILPNGLTTNKKLLDENIVLNATHTRSLFGGIPAGSHIQSINITVNLGREPIYELGKRTPFSRPITFPAEISCEIAVIAVGGDDIGYASSYTPCANPKLVEDKAIKVVLCDGTTFDLGKKNKLKSISYAGDTGGGNTIATYVYSTYNDFTFKPREFTRGTMDALGVLGGPASVPDIPSSVGWFETYPPTDIQ